MISGRLAGQELHAHNALETPPNRHRQARLPRAARVVRRRVNAGAEHQSDLFLGRVPVAKPQPAVSTTGGRAATLAVIESCALRRARPALRGERFATPLPWC